MSRPVDSFYRRIDIRRRYTDIDVVDTALHRLAAQIERGLTAVQSSSPVAVTDYQFGASDGLQDMTFPTQVSMDKVGVNGGGILFLPKGNYTFTDTLRYNHDNLVIVGEGSGTVLTFVGLGLGQNFFEADTVERIGLRDLRIVNDGGSVGLFGVEWTDVEEGFIQDVFFLDCANCIRLISCDGIDISHCADSNTTFNCVSLLDTGVGSTDDISIQLNNFESAIPAFTYASTITGGISPRNVRIENNRPLPAPPAHTIPASNLITRDVLFGAPDRIISVTGANAVDDIEVTFPNDWRIFTVTAATPVFNNNAPGNLRLSAATFTGDAAAGTDTLMLVCDGTNWLEVSRSIN